MIKKLVPVVMLVMLTACASAGCPCGEGCKDCSKCERCAEGHCAKK